ncbi:flagellar hook-associated protein FlgK [Vibrio maerlii]|uniref:flagellar hook-associated protein FlgK n=1 Tax=Vibrio maerlii TaxID=2231648 RepID=UPI000E3BBFA0|nr:flagellar hook-associated protein FlgK [Vibrio maerlii]
MASDLLNVGTQSVLTAQRQLNTTGHNISNANTEGYSRQSVEQGTNMPRQFGGQSYGMGVHVENVRRSWDQFAVNELNLSETNYAHRRNVEENLDMLSGMLSSIASKKIPENVNEWFEGVKTLADTPNDMGARKVVLEKSNLVAQNMREFHEVVRNQSDTTNKRLDLAVERVNQLAVEIRDLHRLMMKTPGPHNDLMDNHEKLVAELSQYTKVTVTPRGNAEGFNVHIGNGHTLVSGTEASQLAMVNGNPDVHQRQLAMVEGKGVKAIKSDSMDGQIGALMKMRDEHIPYLKDELGRMAISFSASVNALQEQGLDHNGNVGENLFTDVNSQYAVESRVVTTTGSTADMAVHIEDITQLKGGDYSVKYDGSNYIVTKPSGEEQTLAPDNTGAFRIDGVRVEVTAPPKAGERFYLRPTRDAAAQMHVVTNDPAKIAAQSYEASTTFAQGNAEFKIVQSGTVKEFEVVISPQGNQFAVLDNKGNLLAAPQNYPPTAPVNVGGTIFELTDGALANDKFTANLIPSEGDNGNLRKMQGIQTAKIVNDKESTVLDLYHDLNTNVGLQMSTATRLSDVARLENEAAKERVASISGVNLDEEAANMMKFQQSYMASSRIMQAANDTFNTILQLR